MNTIIVLMALLIVVLIVSSYFIVKVLNKICFFIGAMESHSTYNAALRLKENGIEAVYTDNGKPLLDSAGKFKPPMARRKNKPWFW